MKKSLTKIIIAGLIAVTMASPAFAAKKKKDAKQKVKTIIIGTGTAYNPYCYLDADGKLVGYEKDVLDGSSRHNGYNECTGRKGCYRYAYGNR